MTFARDISNFQAPAEAVSESFDLVDAFRHAFDSATEAVEGLAGEIEAFVQHACT